MQQDGRSRSYCGEEYLLQTPDPEGKGHADADALALLYSACSVSFMHGMCDHFKAGTPEHILEYSNAATATLQHSSTMDGLYGPASGPASAKVTPSSGGAGKPGVVTGTKVQTPNPLSEAMIWGSINESASTLYKATNG